MRSRGLRYLVLVVLLASGSGAAWSSWNSTRSLAQLDRAQRDLNDQLDHLLAALDSVATAQQFYVTPFPEQDFSHVPDLIAQLRAGTDRLRPQVRSIEAGRALQTVASAVATLQDVDTRSQEHIRLGQELMAADLIVSDGRAADEAIASGLRSIRAAEGDSYVVARADALDFAWTVGGVVAALWVVGLSLLTRVPASAEASEESAMLAPSPLPLTIAEPAAEMPEATYPDLQAAADVCTAVGRLTNAEDLPRLLQQASTVLDASGIVVWMAAGEELFAAAAFGYPSQVIQKLGPINRSAVNATAAAWRTGTLQAVAGNHDARGALAAPMLGPDRCIGVLAVEVGGRGNSNPATRAVTMMFAAQLAAALAGWPAASAAAPVTAPPLERAAEG
jgi:hypothetical protein